MKKLLTVFIFIAVSTLIWQQTSAQKIMSYTGRNFTGLDMGSCATNTIDSAIGSMSSFNGTSTFDQVHHRYFFVSPKGTKDVSFIEGYDLDSNKDISLNTGLSNFGEIEYDDSNNTIYGRFRNSFVWINLSTMVIDSVPVPFSFSGFMTGGSTFDQVHGVFYDVFTHKLQGINVHTHLAVPCTHSIEADWEYCNSDGKFYGVSNVSHPKSMAFVSYDPVHDTIVVIVDSLAYSGGYYSGGSSFDQATNTYILGYGKGVLAITTSGVLSTCSAGGKTMAMPEATGMPSTTHPLTYDTLKGRVTTSTGAALKNTYIYKLLYNISDSTLYADDSTKTDTTGHYQFLTNDSAVYLYASPDSIDYPNELGTYYDSSLTIQLAAMKALHTGTTIVNFNTLSGTNHSGGGFIGGKITICNCKKPGKGQPVPNLRVLLLDSNGNAIKQTYTNASGNFGFNNVGYGKYKIWVDYPKVDNSIAPQISISAAAPNRTDNYSLYPTYLQIYTTTSILAANPETGGLNIYPNPFTQSTNIEYILVANATITLKVYDITGREVANLADEMQTAGKYSYILDANKYSLPAGMYMIKLTVNGETNNEEIIKIK